MDVRGLQQRVKVLEAALATEGVSPLGEVRPTLSNQESNIVGFLLRKYPQAVSRRDIVDTVMPFSYPNQVSVVVHRIREKLGEGAIVSKPRGTYRLGDILIGDVQ